MPLNLSVDWNKYPSPASRVDSTKTKSNSMLGPMMFSAAGDLADGLTTQAALAKGGVEKNPLLPTNRVGNALAQSGLSLAKLYAMKRLNDSGHDRLAKLLGYGTGAVGIGSAIHNVRSNP